MKIEILFPEFCNLYGDSANITYLKKCLKDAEFIDTYLEEEPRFVKEDINLIYLGPMTERTQEKVINKLIKHKDRIQELIENGTNFLFTGNAFEILGEYIENEDRSKIEGLGILDIHSVRNMFNRYNGMLLGKFNDIEMVGFKNQFSHTYGDNTKNYFIEVERGTGINVNSKLEGIKINNFIGTYLLGPILVLNPHFTKYLIKQMGCEDVTLAFEEECINAYNQRLKEFKDKRIKI